MSTVNKTSDYKLSISHNELNTYVNFKIKIENADGSLSSFHLYDINYCELPEFKKMRENLYVNDSKITFEYYEDSPIIEISTNKINFTIRFKFKRTSSIMYVSSYFNYAINSEIEKMLDYIIDVMSKANKLKK
jgi:hypothetical protein